MAKFIYILTIVLVLILGSLISIRFALGNILSEMKEINDSLATIEMRLIKDEE